MPNYGDYLSTNQQGLNNLASSAQLGLKQPTAVDRFMEGLRQAQEMRIQRQAAQGLANYRMGMVGARDEANDLKRQTNDANTKLKFLLTATKLGDPMRAAQALGAAEPENADMYASLATSAKGTSGMGIGAQQAQQKTESTANLQGSQARLNDANATYTAGPKAQLMQNKADLTGIDLQSEDALRQSIINRNNRPPVANSYNVELPPQIVQGMAADVSTNPNLINVLTGRNMKARAQITEELYGGGQNPDLAGAGANYRADTGALADIQKKISSLGAFERTTIKNMDEFVSAASKIKDTGSPLLNGPLRSIDRNTLGNTDQAVYDAVRSVHLPELARVIQTANAAGVLTDEARKEVERINSGDATIPQIIAVSKTMQRLVRNRITELENEATALRGRTSSQNKLKAMLTPKGALPNGVTETGVENGKTWYRWASDGRRHTSLPVNP